MSTSHPHTQPHRNHLVDVAHIRFSAWQVFTMSSGLAATLCSVFCSAWLLWANVQKELGQVRYEQSLIAGSTGTQVAERMLVFEDRWRKALDDVDIQWNDRFLQVAMSNKQVTDKLTDMSSIAAAERKKLSESLNDVQTRIRTIEVEVKDHPDSPP